MKRMKRARRVLALVLTAALLLGLAGCGGSGNVGSGQEPEAELPAPISFHPASFYKTEDLPLTEDRGDMWHSCTDGETFFYLLESQENDTRETVLCRAGLTEGSARRLADYAPVQAETDGRVFPLGMKMDGQGNLWVLESWVIFTYDLPEDFDPETDEKYPYITDQTYHGLLRRLDPETGAALEERDLTEALSPLYGDLIDWLIDGEGRVYFATEAGLTVLDASGQKLAVLEGAVQRSYSNGGSSLCLLADGTAAVLTPEGVRTVAPDGGSWGDTLYSSASGATRIWPGRGEFAFFYSNPIALYGQTADEDGCYKLLDWQLIDSNDQAARDFLLLEDDRVALLSQTGDTPRLTLLTPSDTAADGRTVLTLAAVSNYVELKDRVIQFNKSSPDYFVVIKNYTDGLDQSGLDWGEVTRRTLERLNVDLTAGKVPDLIAGESLPIQQYAAKGYLEDLWPWIDSDPELARDQLMEHVLDCASLGGKLYTAGSSFTLNVLTAPASRIGDGSGYTLKDLMDLYDDMPEGSYILEAGKSPAAALQALSQSGESFVDWAGGTCSFDSSEFVRLLELCDRQPREDPQYADHFLCDDGGAALREGRQLLCRDYIYNMDTFLANEARCGGPDALWDYLGMLRAKGANMSYTTSNLTVADNVVHGALKDERYASFLQFPTGGGGTSAGSFELSDLVVMPAACPNKEGAWSFIRQLLLPGGSLYPDGTNWDGSAAYFYRNFPINKADFETKMVQEMEPRYYGGDDPYLDAEGNPVEVSDFPERVGHPVTMFVYILAVRQSDVDRFMDLYNAVNQVEYRVADPLWNILAEQTAPFFAGEISAKAAAKSIQKRAELYLGELS